MARKTTNIKTALSPSQEECAHWKHQIELAENDADKWVKRGEKILLRYRDDRPDSGDDVVAKDKGRYNIFWSNVQTLRPSIYGREPVPIAERRFLDKDVVGRVASQMLERAMRYEMMDCGFHDTLQRDVLDYLTVGRGIAWWRFTPAFGPASSIVERGDDQLEQRDGEPVETERTAETDEHDESNAHTDGAPAEKLIGATVNLDYVNWKDFLHSRARTWEETEWIAKRIYMSRQDLVDNFGEKIGNEIPLDHTTDSRKDREAQTNTLRQGMQKATVYEIWCKYDRTVRFVAKEYPDFCEAPRPDPLNLEGFWPVARPLFATMTNDTLLPVPDYAEYQDQAYELDRLTQRLDLLVAAIQVRGVYNSSNNELARLLDESNENKMIPVASWAGFSEKGGLKGAVDFLPIEQVVDAAKSLFEARDQIKKDLYEITGLADVIRGQSDPRETAQAVATKGRFGSLRLQERQAEVARFARDNIRIMGEIISEHYPDQTLIDISGIMYDEGVGPEMPVEPPKPDEQPQSPMMGHNGGPPLSPQGAQAPQGPPMAPGAPPSPSQGMQPPPGASVPSQQPGMAPPATPQLPPELQYALAMQAYQHKKAKAEAEKIELIQRAIALLRQDKLRGFRIDIETDSTVIEDANEEKGKRVEFISALSGFLEKSVQAAQVYPEIVPLLGKMILFAVRGFRVGRDLESAIEEFIDKAEKDIKKQEGQPKPPDPKIQAEQAKAQAEIKKAEIDAQASADDNRRAMEQKAADSQLAQQKAQMEMAKMQAELELERERMAMEREKMQGELVMAREKHQLEMTSMQHSAQLKEREHARSIEAGELAHRQQLEAGDLAHKRGLEAGEVAHKQKLQAFKMQPNHANGAEA